MQPTRHPNTDRGPSHDARPVASRAGSVLMAGAGIQGGAIIGATDTSGSEPATRPWYPEDIAASIYHALGMDANTTYYPRLPRPTKIAEGEVVEGLFA